jgi:glycosyltransferase involved in cell wall biosynthesis
MKNWRPLVHQIRRADAVHVPIPGDVGTVGMLLAYVLRKPLFVRYCGNWFVQCSVAERFWKWFMEYSAGGRNVMLATGGAPNPPSRRNRATRWIFSTTLTEEELNAVRTQRRDRAVNARLIIVCRQERPKGTEVVIDSLPLILERLPSATLHVVGDGSDLPMMKERAAEVGISSRVTFHGAVDHASVLQLLLEAELFCYPTSASEGFPKVVLEALACGLPVVTTHVSVLPYLVDGCGVLLDTVTPKALADAVCTCLAEPDRYYAMSARATERAREFSLERWRDTIADHLRAAWGPLQSRV